MLLSKNRKIVTTTNHIQEVLNNHIRSFRDPGAIHCIDSNLDIPELWDKSKLRVLIVFVSTLQARSVASTDNVIINLIKSAHGDDVYVDMCNLQSQR